MFCSLELLGSSELPSIFLVLPLPALHPVYTWAGFEVGVEVQVNVPLNNPSCLVQQRHDLPLFHFLLPGQPFVEDVQMV